MKLDLGCGGNKHPGFFGIDRLPSEDTDLVWDLDRGLPLPDSSVEWVMASRVLPFVTDLEAVLSEIYRVCIHKAILCVLAPYAHSFRHQSNPLLRHKFDEHTPRYWTNHFFQPDHGPVSPAVPHYSAPLASLDFRLVRMELFYHESFRNPLYDGEDLEELIALQANVADEIMYHYVAVKGPIAKEELEELAHQAHMEPLHAEELRIRKEWPVVEEQEPLPGETEAPLPLASAASRLPPGRSRKKKPRILRPRKKRSRYSP